jgi:CHAT domain-containing protein
MVPLGKSSDVIEHVERWRAAFADGKTRPTDRSNPAAELRMRLWEPLAKHLYGVNLVLISPDGPMNRLSWAALPGSKKGTFLIQDYAFAIVSVPQLLPELRKSRTSSQGETASLAVGDVDFDAAPDTAARAKRENHFPALRGTQAEVTGVADLFRATFPRRPAALLTGGAATKEAFMSRSRDCSHLLVATHGFFLPEPNRDELEIRESFGSAEWLGLRRDLIVANPALCSGLVFAGANYAAMGQGSAFLTALEASEIDLRRVDLAVLSACETGLGKVEGGEGVLGLQRAFQLAGARTVVTSLWKVPDKATQALMIRFHRNLWEKKMPKLEALREAQLWMITEGWKNPALGLRSGLQRPEAEPQKGDSVSPFYWAAFVLSGDWR